jgi:undecaprenyl-diphosphatase
MRRAESPGTGYGGSRPPTPRLRHAVALGLLQGPTELLPVSSSGHTTLIPWLADWPYAELDPELRKSFEVALHAGAGAALAIDMRTELLAATRKLDRRRTVVIALSLGLPALAGYALERPIERRLGGPRSIAAGLIAGAVAMALADLRPGREEDGAGTEGQVRGTRREAQAGACDGLALGLAQAAALAPGVSRNGATLAAARARGFRREDAQTLSWHAALPVILGASALKAWRIWQRGVPEEAWPVLAAGAGSAFVSTTASTRLLRRPRVGTRPLLLYAVYRCLLALLVLRRLARPCRGAGERPTAR